MLHSSALREKSDRALVEAAKGGDETAFRELIEPLARELGAYAYRMLGAFHDAEDALQETRIKAWRHLSTYEPHASFRAWVYRIATNTCLDMLRKEQRRVFPRDVGPPVEPGPSFAQSARMVLPDSASCQITQRARRGDGQTGQVACDVGRDVGRGSRECRMTKHGQQNCDQSHESVIAKVGGPRHPQQTD